MSAQQKLTKKQKKALAFRERKGKSKALPDEEDHDVPIDENQDLADMDDFEMEVDKDADRGKAQIHMANETERGPVKDSEKGPRKRKREQAEDLDEVDKHPRKKKADKISPELVEKDGSVRTSSLTKKTPQRFILFIGNLRYATSKETILAHFSACDPPPTVRLPTLKATEPISKSKGYAFLEFTEKQGLQVALKLHHSELEGRKINVELTAGGGGKSERRLNKVKERNKGLHDQRRRRIQKEKTSAGADNDDQLKELERPQRYSSTSGFGQAPSNKKTWSIADSSHDLQSSGSKKSKRRPHIPKDKGTGVNAIPIY